MTTTTALTIADADSTTFDGGQFLKQVRGLSFSQVGVLMLIRSHMLLSPNRCMTKAGIHAALRTRTPFAIDLVAGVIDEMFEVDADGSIFCPALDL